MPVRVSIIVVNWNGLEMTSAALRSLQAHAKDVEYELIVVDNGSHDGSPAELSRRFPEAKLLANQQNEGFSRACNRAARTAVGDYLLFLNNDTVQIEGALSKAVRYLDERPEVGALGIQHLDSSEGRAWQPSAFRFPRPSSDVLACLGLARLAIKEEGYGRTKTVDVDWVCGSFLLVRRGAWLLVGEFDERFFVYDEDIDWCLRARRAGVVVRYWPEASMVHLGAASGPRLRDKTFMHFRSRMTYFAKNEPPFWPAAFYLAMSTRLTASSLVQVMKLATGRAGVDDVKERLRRLSSFVSLRSTRAGLKTA